MPGATPNYAFPYQLLSDPPHGPNLGQQLATAVDDALKSVEDSAAADTADVAADLAALDVRVIRLEGRTLSARTATVGPFTTETVLDTIAVPVVSGRTYRISWHGPVQSTVADGYVRARLRLTNVAGTQIQLGQISTATVASQSFPLHMVTLWTAPSTTTQTFVATALRQTGTGNISSFADAATPACFVVEYMAGS